MYDQSNKTSFVLALASCRKKIGVRESYYPDEKEGRQKNGLNRYLYTLVLRIIIENHINLKMLKIRNARRGSWMMQN